MAASRPTTIVFPLGGFIARADLPGLCERMRASLERSDAVVALCDVSALAAADAVAIDALARLQLTARRLGREIRLRNASDELLELLAFMGLGDVVPEWALRLEPSRQTEEREQRLGVEEEGELDDPAR